MVATAYSARPRQSGVSLVEALMALAVMAFGALALVGVQTTLRLNNDLSKQRSEATRIATEEIEGMRVFTSVAPQNGQTDWISLASRTIEAYVPPDGIGNTTYRVVRTVAPVAGTQQIIVRVQVQWTDRTGTQQTVTLDSTIVGAAPVLSALMSVPALASATNQVNGRDPTIPKEAVDIDNHRRSAYKPFDRGTVVWLFDNTSGEIVSRCSGVVTAQASITQTDIDDASCPPIHGRLLAGVVRFNLVSASFPAGYSLPLNAATPLDFDVAQPRFPLSPNYPGAECVTDPNAPQRNDGAAYGAGDAITWIRQYECLVSTIDPPPDWGGKIKVVAASRYPDGSVLPDAHVLGDYKVCRYTTASADYTSNADHPLSYCVEKASPAPTADVPCNGNKVTKNLLNQNFLVIAATADCPANTAAAPLPSNATRLHQSSL